jgi:hypothetical protein
MSRGITVEDRLSLARGTAAVLSSLSATDRTMRHKDLAIAIGLMRATDKWEAAHRNQITDILNLTAAAEYQGSNADPLQFERIVGQDGQPGAGFHKTSRIVASAT